MTTNGMEPPPSSLPSMSRQGSSSTAASPDIATRNSFASSARSSEPATPSWSSTSSSTHKHPKVKAWLERHPRVHFHCLPTSTSWLNLVERFFSELTQRQLKRLVVNNVAELEQAIDRYIDARNRDPKPFTWTAAAETILEKVRRDNRTFEALH